MRFPLPKKRRHWITLGVIAPMLVVLLFVSGVFPWSPLNCWHDDVDIRSGRVRHTRYLLFFRIGDRTEDTWVSRALDGPADEPDWRRVNTFSPGLNHSPHYTFHGAISQIETLGLADRYVPFEPDARRKVAAALLGLWQSGESYSAASEFVEEVAQAASALRDRGASAFKALDVPGG